MFTGPLGLGAGVGALGEGASAAADNWMGTGEDAGGGDGVGVGFVAPPPAAERTMTGGAAGDGGVPLGDTLEVEVEEGTPPGRLLLRMLIEPLGERVEVVVVLRGFANSVTVTVTTAGLLLPGFPVLDVSNEIVVEERSLMTYWQVVQEYHLDFQYSTSMMRSL